MASFALCALCTGISLPCRTVETSSIGNPFCDEVLPRFRPPLKGTLGEPCRRWLASSSALSRAILGAKDPELPISG